LQQGGKLRGELKGPSQDDLPAQLDINRASNRVLAVAREQVQRELPETLVTQDTNLRVKAKALEVPVMRYLNSSGNKGFYEGVKTIQVEKNLLHQLRLQETIDPTEKNQEVVELEEFLPNEGLHLINGAGVNEELLAIYREEDKHFQNLERRDKVGGVKPRNLEQRRAREYLLDPDIHVVSLPGKTGTGKTPLALAEGQQLKRTQKP
jgi:Predicted ATPase related to phosphate starvation-inducible protein PhoH